MSGVLAAHRTAAHAPLLPSTARSLIVEMVQRFMISETILTAAANEEELHEALQ
jgi:deoxyhypusine synthase